MEKIKIDDLSLWECFYWVCVKDSFTHAAKQLGVSVPLLSKKVSRLEDILGSRLFSRTTRRVSMTAEAKQFFPQVESLLEQASQIEGVRAGAQEAGIIRLACMPAYAQRCLPELLVRFQKQHPQIEFELYVSDSVTDLIESQIDVAIRVQKPTGAQFVFRKLIQNELIWVASPKYLAGHRVIKRPSDLKQHCLLTLSVYRNCRVGEGVLRVEDISRLTPIRCESGAVLTELALQHAGIALRSTWDVAPLVKNGRLVRILEKYPVENFGDVFAVTPHARFLTRRVRLFLEFLQSR